MMTGAPLNMKESAAVPLRNMAGVSRKIRNAVVEMEIKRLCRPARRSAPPYYNASRAQGRRNEKGETLMYLSIKEITRSRHVSNVPEYRALTAPQLSANSDIKSGRCHNEAV